jgi:hypothetical protein
MPKPIAVAKGVAVAFPDVCKTPAPPAPPVPVPYPNVAQLDQASGISDEAGRELLVGPAGDHVLLADAKVDTSTGDEAGSAGGVRSGGVKGACTVVQASGSVLYGPQGKGVARFLDRTEQNGGNAQGNLLSAFPTVQVGD